MTPIHVGDIVRAGNGRTLWRVTTLWLHGETALADLQQVDREWVRRTDVVDRLERVETQP